MKNFLTETQITELTEKEWDVNPKGFYNLFHKDELPTKVWDSLCEVAKVSTDCTKIKLLSVGVAIK